MAENDPIDTGSGLSANPDDAKGYRRGTRARAPGASAASRSVGTSVLMAILVAGLMVAGWFIATQHQALAAAQQLLGQSEKRIAVLEERLQVTDAVMSESDKEVTDTLGKWQDEVRKLWDVTNKRNKGWIQENQAKIKAHDANLAAIDKSLKDLKADSDRFDAALGQQTALIDQLAAIELQVRQQANQQRALTDQLNATRQSVAGLETNMTRRVTENEKAVQAIDAYRLQLNSRLVELQTRVDNLSVRPTP
ncbi:MAG: hypothetical protein HC809_06575 [Gammaproteobacteria bacterium]|nr:hypothetical protein [Gammaproteobacteria bacterium]